MKLVAALMLKAPRPGTVKTRLAKSVGAARAADIYRQLVEGQLNEIPAQWSIALHYAPADGLVEMQTWLAGVTARGIGFHAQPEGDLGRRMQVAVAHHLGAGADAVALIGGDCPGLSAAVLANAASRLRTENVVIIPAMDGGYVCLMTRQPVHELFAGIEWSTEKVLAQTLKAAKSAGLAVALLDPLEDVDDVESLQRSGITLRP